MFRRTSEYDIRFDAASIPGNNRYGRAKCCRDIRPSVEPVIEAATQPAAAARPKVVALASVYYYLSHAYHIVGRFLDGFPVYDGRPEALQSLRSRSPACSSSKLQRRPTWGDRKRSGMVSASARRSPMRLTLGTGKLAVDAVLLIAEHGVSLQREASEALSTRPVLSRRARRVPGVGPGGAGFHRQAFIL